MEEKKPRDLNASTLEACRICLATDVKLHCLGDTQLGTCLKSIAAFTDTCIGLPNYVCYQCAPILLKCGQLIAKIKTAQATLLDIFNKNGQLTKTLLKERNKSKNLESSVSSNIMSNCDYIQHHSDDNASECIETESVRNKKNEEFIETESVRVTKNKEFLETEPVRDIKNETVEPENKDENAETDITELDNSVEEIKVETPLVELSDDEDFISLVPHMLKEKLQKCTKGISSKFHHPERSKQSKQLKKKTKKRKLRENRESAPVGNRSKNVKAVPVGTNWSKNTDSPAVSNNWSKKSESELFGNNWSIHLESAPVSKDWLEFIDIQRDFTVSKIPFNEQLTVWRHSMVLKCIQTGSELLCSVCQKPFSNADLLQAHSYFHNPSIHGNLKCGVCLICFSTVAALDYHTETIHANRFNCKSCPMAFHNLEDAKCHKDLCMGPIAYGGSPRSTIPVRGPTLNRRPSTYDPRPQMGNQQSWYLSESVLEARERKKTEE